MAWSTEQAITTSKITVFDKTVDKLGPKEFTFSADQDINLYFTGTFPGPTTAVLLRTADGERAIGNTSESRAITKIECETVSGTGTLKMIPTVL